MKITIFCQHFENIHYYKGQTFWQLIGSRKFIITISPDDWYNGINHKAQEFCKEIVKEKNSEVEKFQYYGHEVELNKVEELGDVSDQAKRFINLL